MSGGKGGSSTNEVTIPEYIEAAAQRNLNKAERISQIGYTPYYGPDVAAFTPMQQAAFQNTADTAGAFGMAAPTSQQDIMGGMPAPTTYAGGVQGYSSAPMFEQSLDELGRQRPGQKSYIDSFFIDPFTGGGANGNFAPIDYTQYGTMADQAASNRQNDLAIAQAQAGASSSVSSNADFTGGNPALADYDLNNYNPTSTDPYGNYTTDFTGGNSALAEYDLGGYAPTSTDPYGDYSGDSGDYSGSGGYTSIGDMFDGGGAGTAGDTYSGGGVVSDLGNSVTTSVDLPGNVFSRALNIGAGKKDSSSDSGYAGSSNDGTVLCTAYCNMGYLPREIYKLDRRYGVSLYRNDPSLILGYRKWATPIAEFIKTDTMAAKATRAVMWPIVKAWAEQMAHEMKPQKYSRNIAGKAIMLVGVPFSRLVGAIFVDKSVSKEAF
jgi:hypothetical protein